MRNYSGLLVSFEGIDKCGKSTQVELLKNLLSEKDHPYKIFREPGSTSISEQIRRILLSHESSNMGDLCETLLYSAARAQLVGEKIIPALKDGFCVILDRYYHSTTAYQGYGRGIPLELINKVNAAASQGYAPDITFILDISPEEASKRRDEAGRDRLESSSLQFFRAVRNGYLKMMENDPRLVKLDGTFPIDSVFEIISNNVLKQLAI